MFNSVVVPPRLNPQVEDEQLVGLAAVNVPNRILLPVVWVMPLENVRVSLVVSPK